jgi:hypothetical protein
MWAYDEIDDESAYDRALVGELTVLRVAKFVIAQLNKIAVAIKGMCLSIDSMREGCHPFIFYHRVRPFLSGWKDNPILPKGVIYQGVSETPMQFYGGSAAQSALLPFLDIALGVSHIHTKSHVFLQAMRNYMIKPHREFLIYFETISCIREFVLEFLPSGQSIDPVTGMISLKSVSVSSGEDDKSTERLFSPVFEDGGHKVNKVPEDIWLDLSGSYNDCISNIERFRSSHINLVAEYIIAQQKNGVSTSKLEGSAGGKGTGGTDLMKFLKPIRDNVKNNLIVEPDNSNLVQNDLRSSYNHSTGTTLTRVNTLSRANSLRDNTSKLPPVSTAAVEASIPIDNENDTPYHKDNAGNDDIDLFRGASYINLSKAFHYRQPEDINSELWVTDIKK